MSQVPGTPLSAELRESLLRTIPHLRAFAISLTGTIDQADDLVQEAILRGLKSIDRFEPGTSMQAWLFTILRNQFHTQHRRRRREVEDPNGIIAGQVAVPPEQQGRLDLDDLRSALAKLSFEQREVLLLIGAEGLGYEEAAAIVGTKVGTVKSRMHRARARLAELLHLETEDDLGNGSTLTAALGVPSTKGAGMESGLHVMPVLV